MPKEEKETEEKEEDDEENSELEDVIENEEEKVSERNFSNSIENYFSDELELEDFSPSLEKVNAPQRNPFVRLEQNLEDAPVSEGKDEEDPFKYSATKKNSEEQNYISYDSVSSEISKISDIERDARKTPLEKMQSVGFMPSEQPEISSDKKYEVYNPMQQDLTKLGKESEFEKLEKKQMNYRPSAR